LIIRLVKINPLFDDEICEALLTTANLKLTTDFFGAKLSNI